MEPFAKTTQVSNIQASRPAEIAFADRLLAARSPEQVAGCLSVAYASRLSKQELSAAFISRGKALADDASETDMRAVINSVHAGAFHSNSTIRASAFSRPVTLQDSALYGAECLVAAILCHYEPEMSPEMIKGQFLSIGLTAQAFYFESFRRIERFPQERANFLDGTNDQEALELSALRGKQFVKCAERAPVFANVMAALGDNQLTVLSSCSFKPGSEGMHVFNVARREQRYVIIDPTNSVVWRHQNGDRHFSPACYTVGPEQMDEFVSGKPVTFPHMDMQEVAPKKFQAREGFARAYKLPKAVHQSEILRAFFA